MSGLITVDVFLRHTPKDGAPHVAAYRCWSTPKFIASQQAAAAKEKGSVTPITEAEYKAARSAK